MTLTETTITVFPGDRLGRFNVAVMKAGSSLIKHHKVTVAVNESAEQAWAEWAEWASAIGGLDPEAFDMQPIGQPGPFGPTALQGKALA